MRGTRCHGMVSTRALLWFWLVRVVQPERSDPCYLIVGFIRVSGRDMERMGYENTKRSYMARYREQDGGGYLATVEVFHQLHCLVGGVPPSFKFGRLS